MRRTEPAHRRSSVLQIYLRFSVQPVFSLSDGDGLVEDGVLENVALQEESGGG